MPVFFLLLILFLPLPFSVLAEDLGELSADPYNPESTAPAGLVSHNSGGAVRAGLIGCCVVMSSPR